MRWGIQIKTKIFRTGRENIPVGSGVQYRRELWRPRRVRDFENRKFRVKTLRTLPVIREKKHRKKSHPTLLFPVKRKTIAAVWQIWTSTSQKTKKYRGTRGRRTTGPVKSGAKIRRRSKIFNNSQKTFEKKSEDFLTLRKTFRQTATEEVEVAITAIPHLSNQKWRGKSTTKFYQTT